MSDWIARANHFFWRDVWQINTAALPRWRRWALHILKTVIALVRDVAGGQLTLRAMSLVYTTLLSLVPLLAVSFSVLKAFGVHNMIEPILDNFLKPLGPEGVQISANIITFVENMKVGVLGSLGLAMLFFTVISLIQKIEDAFNSIWRTGQSRSFLERFSEYLSVILIGPVLVFSALGLTASMVSTTFVQKMIEIEPFGTAFYIAGLIVPYFLIIAAFTFVYTFVPNTKVMFRSALLGATLAGVCWKTAGWGFALFIASSVQYNAIYSSFAILIIFLIWTYLSWLILLLGAQIAFYYQHPEFIHLQTKQPTLSNRLKEKLGLLLVFLIGESHYCGQSLWTLEALTTTLKLPAVLIEEVLRIFLSNGFIVETNDSPSRYMPAKDSEHIALKDIFSVLRRANEDDLRSDEQYLAQPDVDHVIAQLWGAASDVLAGQTLRDMVQSSEVRTKSSTNDPKNSSET